ncbi:Short-chain dehydrogenase/reductase, conserved site,NAD(P)-binding domain,Short-chain [Cinara cedri]|uniref:carbonyl reductase (NADPH) n=1 Tax=Cinara cedri TaxID=506608 RepID=A0A5E4N8X6_9HEMI|nr:Short-chain dehydrogenase/reductase, conserved site,NAD(P)-binding domain,Short-chain [Cinara cedri]
MCSAKLAIVTGSNKGIGYAVVKALCDQFDGDVYLTARDVSRGEKAVQTLNVLGLKPKFHQLDVTDDGSVAEFKRFVEKNYAGINVLVNNAAIRYREDSAVSFAEQAAETSRVNYFALRRVCDALFPLLLPGARVVNVSSCAGLLSRIPGDGLRAEFSSPDLTVEQLDGLVERFVNSAAAVNHEQSGWPSSAYVVSKVAVSALTIIQQKEFDVDPRRKDIVVNSVHPGYVDTDMTSHMVGMGIPLSIDQGAEALVYLALLPEGEQRVKGQYVWNDKTVKNWREFVFEYN